MLGCCPTSVCVEGGSQRCFQGTSHVRTWMHIRTKEKWQAGKKSPKLTFKSVTNLQTSCQLGVLGSMSLWEKNSTGSSRFLPQKRAGGSKAGRKSRRLQWTAMQASQGDGASQELPLASDGLAQCLHHAFAMPILCTTLGEVSHLEGWCILLVMEE